MGHAALAALVWATGYVINAVIVFVLAFVLAFGWAVAAKLAGGDFDVVFTLGLWVATGAALLFPIIRDFRNRLANWLGL